MTKKNNYWTHFILESFCLFDIFKMSGAKPKQVYRWDENSKKFVPTGDKIICPPKSERILDSKAYCKTPGRPNINKCFRANTMCPFFAYLPVTKKEYVTMVRAWARMQ